MFYMHEYTEYIEGTDGSKYTHLTAGLEVRTPRCLHAMQQSLDRLLDNVV